MNGRRITTVTGSENAASGMATPSGLPSSPMCFSNRYSGRLATLIGNNRPIVNSV